MTDDARDTLSSRLDAIAARPLLVFPVQRGGRGTRPRSLYELLQDPFTLGDLRPTEPVEVVVERTCRYCGCTDDRACADGCWWVADDVCSSCGAAARADGVDVGGIRRTVRARLEGRRPDRTDIDALTALAASQASIDPTTCRRCDGCGQLADDEDQTPWKYWEALPAGSNLAVVLRLVEPFTCPECNGRGTVPRTTD